MPFYNVIVEINIYLVIHMTDLVHSLIISSRMMVKGYKQPLEEKDLWCLNIDDCSEQVVPQLVHYWNAECEKVKRLGAWH